MSRRAQIRKLAKTDNVAALKLVPTLTDVRERIQALGWIARYADPKRVKSIVNSAVDAATEFTRSETDFYAPAVALAWPLRALHETGNLDSVPRVRDIALGLLPSVEPCSSRTECHIVLLNAVIPSGLSAADPVIDSLIANCAEDDHWRIVRAFIDAAILVNGFNRPRAAEIAAAIADEKKREATITRLQAGESNKPRKFFW